MRCASCGNCAMHRPSAAMSSRTEAAESLGFFPTPPWATRALMEKVLGDKSSFMNLVCWEPACGAGHMSEVLKEYFAEVVSTDIADYGYGESCVDFLDPSSRNRGPVRWIITNPPFNLAEQFARQRLYGENMALLVRTAWLDGAGRYKRLFSIDPPSIVAQFTERVTMVKGALAGKGVSTATAYCWVVWSQNKTQQTLLRWIPPCKKALGG